MNKVIAIWVTTKCNLKCRYCYEGDHIHGESLSFENADKVINFIKKFKEPNERIIIDFHGGEPLINFDVVKYIIKECNKLFDRKEVDYCITSNGVLFNDEILDFLVNNFNYSLSVSLDGKKETHDFNRSSRCGHGSFDKAYNGALAMLKRRPDVRARLTFDKSNINNLSENIIFLIESGFKCIVPGVDWFCKDWVEEDFDKIYEELLIVKKYINKNNLDDVCVGGINEEITEVGICAGGSSSVHISPTGDLYPCSYTVGNKKYLIGNIDTGINQKVNSSFREMLASENKACEGCNNYSSCYSTRCKFANELVTGDCNVPAAAICHMENIRVKLSKNNGRD